MKNFKVKIATSQKEIEAAQRLRFEVFNLEIKGDTGFPRSYDLDLDKDKFDFYCDHIIILEPENEKVIGTYRLLLGTKAKHVGFYSENKFDLSNIKKLNGELLELGRSCIQKDYRNKNTLNLLWQGIAEYVFQNNVKYIFGCPSIRSKDPKEVSKIFFYLKRRFYSEERYRVYPLEKNSFQTIEFDSTAERKKLLRSLPALFQAYLKVGAKVCGYPAISSEFQTTIFFMLLDVDDISNLYKKHFLKNTLSK